MKDKKQTPRDHSKSRPKNLNGGRPPMFPNTEIEKRMVTLPAELWRHIETIDDSISLAVFEIADKDMRRKMKREARNKKPILTV